MNRPSENNILHFVRRVQLYANTIIVSRIIAFPLLLVLLTGIAISLFSAAFEQTINSLLWINIAKIITIICAIILMIISLRTNNFWSKARTIKEIESRNNIGEIAALSAKDEKIASGDIGLWVLAKHKRDAALNGLRPPKLIGPKDSLLLVAVFISLLAFSLSPNTNINSIKPNFSLALDGAPLEISAIAVAPEYTKIPNLDLSGTSKRHEIPQRSIVEIKVNGAKSAPFVSYGSQKQRMQKIGINSWQASMRLDTSAKLKVHRFGVQKAWRIKIKKDQAPRIDKNFSIASQNYDSLNVNLSAFDDYGIKAARLVLQGINKSQETIVEIDANQISLGENSSLSIRTSHSALVGQKVIAYVEIEDEIGQKAISRKQKLDLPKPIFNTLLANALQEIRLLILLELKDYKKAPADFMWIYDNETNAKIKLIATDNLKNAPKNIVRAYEILNAIYSVRANLGLNIAQSMSLTYAIKSLEYAKSRNEAFKVADTLWNIIETFEHNNLDSRTKIAQKIAQLKSAMKSGASEEEIQMLRSELMGAISEHLQNLAEQSGESGDMELAEGEMAGNIDINQVLNDAQNDASSGNTDEADAKLDELNQLLSNLQPGGNSGGQSISIDGMGQSGQINPLAEEQQKLLDETKIANPNDLGALIERQENLLSQIGENQDPETPSDPNQNEARAAMSAALEALKNGDLDTAQSAQEAAISALKKGTQGQNIPNNANDNYNRDPLGRKLPNPNSNSNPKANSNHKQKNNSIGANGTNDGSETKLPTNSSPLKANDILNRIREKLSNPDQSEEEKNYLENAISNH